MAFGSSLALFFTKKPASDTDPQSLDLDSDMWGVSQSLQPRTFEQRQNSESSDQIINLLKLYDPALHTRDGQLTRAPG